MMPRPPAPDPDTVTVGLVNNMPDSALKSTERQFRTLLSAAAGGRQVRLRLFHLAEVPRSEAARALLRDGYEDVSVLQADDLVDGLIVTGAEPRTANMRDEPYWTSLTRLVDWAEEHTTSTIWSCLAAHAAVVHRGGIARRPLGAKLSGVFDCTKSADHPLVAGLPMRWRMPHSRYNELPEEALAANGYQILSRSAEAGVDLFATQDHSLFLYAQGHPEYDAGALLREYQRDAARFLAGERQTYPDMPRFYFEPEPSAAFAEFRLRALGDPKPDLIGEFPAAGVAQTLSHAWRVPAVGLYANWLGYLCEQKAVRSRASRLQAPFPDAQAPDEQVSTVWRPM